MGPKNYINLTNYYRLDGQPVIIQAHKLGRTLQVVAPMSFKLRWPDVKAAGWKEVDHEAGVISEEEWKRLVAE